MRNLRMAAVVLLALLVALAYTGIGELLPAADPGARLYMTLQLFFVEGEWTLSHAQLPWQVQVVRFIAPVFLVAGLALLFVQGALTALQNATVRLLRDHVIVVGLNDMSVPFLHSARNSGRMVVVVCSPSQQDEIAEVRAAGVRVLTGNVLEPRVLQRAGIARAGHLVAFLDDGVNVELAMRVRRSLKATRAATRPALKARLHLRDTRLGERLEEYPKFFDDAGLLEISLFNVGERTARMLLQRYPLEVYADSLGLQRVKVVLFGFNDIARNMALATARQAHYADGQRACVMLVAPDARAAARTLLHEHPLLDEAVDLRHIDADLSNESLLEQLSDELADASMFVVCLDNDIRSVEFSLFLRRGLVAGRGMNAPIMVHTRNGGGIARLLEADEADTEVPDGLYPFGVLTDVLAVGSVVDERVDEFAVAIHGHYVDGLQRRTRPSHQDWPRLPEVWRRENRHQADHMNIKFRAVGMRMVRGYRGAQVELAAEEIELLARMEKARWLAGQKLRGYRLGERRGEYDRTHSLMLPWEQLSDDAREYDRTAARALPEVVRQGLGLDLARELLIGLCVFADDDAAFDGALAEVEALAADHPDHIVGVMSCARLPLERRVVSEIQRRLQARVYVALPLPDDLYLLDLEPGGEEAVAAYRRAVGHADWYFELPLRFGGHDELSINPEARAQQVALAHAYLLQRCDAQVLVGASEQRARIEHWQAHGVDPRFRFEGRFFAQRLQAGSASPRTSSTGAPA